MIVDDSRSGVPVIYAEGYINMQGGEELLRVARQLIDKGKTTLLLNLAGTRLVNSIGLAILIELIEKVIEIKGRLAFCSLTPSVLKAFETLGFPQYAAIYGDELAALAELLPEGGGLITLGADSLAVPQPDRAELSGPKVVLISATELILKALRRDMSEVFKLTPDQFELLICDRLTAMGFDVNRIGTINSSDGGVDIVSWPKRSAFPFLLAVQVKHRRRAESKVGPGPVKDLKAVVQSSPFDAGLLVTNTSFTPDAHWWAAHGTKVVRLRGLEDLQRWIAGSFLGDELRDFPERIQLAPGLSVTLRRTSS